MSKVASSSEHGAHRYNPYDAAHRRTVTRSHVEEQGEEEGEGEVGQVVPASSTTVTHFTNHLWLAALRKVAVKYSAQLLMSDTVLGTVCEICEKELQDNCTFLCLTYGTIRCLSCWDNDSWTLVSKLNETMGKDAVHCIMMTLAPFHSGELSLLTGTVGHKRSHLVVFTGWANELERRLENVPKYDRRTKRYKTERQKVFNTFTTELKERKKLVAQIYDESHNALLPAPLNHDKPLAGVAIDSPAPSADILVPPGDQVEAHSPSPLALALPPLQPSSPEDPRPPCAAGCPARPLHFAMSPTCRVCKNQYCESGEGCRVYSSDVAVTLWYKNDKPWILRWIRDAVGPVGPEFVEWLHSKAMKPDEVIRHILSDRRIRAKHFSVLPEDPNFSLQLWICPGCAQRVLIAELYSWWCENGRPQPNPPQPTTTNVDAVGDPATGGSSETSSYAKDDTWDTEADGIFHTYGYLVGANKPTTHSGSANDVCDAGEDGELDSAEGSSDSEHGDCVSLGELGEESELGYAESDGLTDSGNEADVDEP